MAETNRKSPAITEEKAIELFKTMTDIRVFEEEVYRLYQEGALTGMSPHLYIGEEAIAAGVIANLWPEDYIISTHRGHGHCLAKGATMDRMLAELMGKETGYCKGRGGSMHIADVKTGNLGANGIVGAGLPIACGAAYSAKYRNSNQITVCFFGDAASNQGTFHEALNFSAGYNLPVLWVCENNRYGLSTPIELTCPTEHVCIKADGYCIENKCVDGMDIEKVYAAAKRVVDIVRSEYRPYFLEFETYRYFGHGASDNRSYRTREEENAWWKRCPIKLFKKKLVKKYGFEESEIEKVEQESKTQMEQAIEFARQSPDPDIGTVLENVYA